MDILNVRVVLPINRFFMVDPVIDLIRHHKTVALKELFQELSKIHKVMLTGGERNKLNEQNTGHTFIHALHG